MSIKLDPASLFPRTVVPRLGGGELDLGSPAAGSDWRLVIVYRGKHCPICAGYLKEIEALAPRLTGIGIDVVVVSADPEAKAAGFAAEVGLTVPVGHSLSVAQMQALGLYVSDPRSAAETDRPFAEPGMFVVSRDGVVRMVDVANAPFIRPDLGRLAAGLEFVRANEYPIRGTHAA